jgi:DNA helicase-2/ATP-dependent DNA helicase PcrA
MDIKAFLSLALNHNDTEAFMQIYYKCGFTFNKQFASIIKHQSLYTRKTIPQIMKKESASSAKLYAQAIAFEKFLFSIKTSRPCDAIGIINKKYEGYLRRNNIGTGKVDILRSIAKYENSISDFLDRLDNLPELIKENAKDNDEAIILSTIHSAKGLEYDKVYLMDVFDGVFPSVELSVSSSETEKELYEEERRLYYVGITRAKKELYLFSLADKKCSFVSETVPKIPPATNKNTTANHVSTVQQSTHRLNLGGTSKHTSSQPILYISESSSSKVVIDDKLYTIGTSVYHKMNGKGKITEMTLIANDIRRHQVKIEFEKGEIGKFELEVLIKKHLLSM